MKVCDSCGVEAKKRKGCGNHCGAMLCAECGKPPKGFPPEFSTVNLKVGNGVEWEVNQCQFCKRRGEPLTGAQFKKLGVGDWFWVIWCKDGNPEHLRFNCPQRIVESQESGDILCADWSFGKERKDWDNEWGAPDHEDHNSYDTCRGDAYFFHFDA